MGRCLARVDASGSCSHEGSDTNETPIRRGIRDDALSLLTDIPDCIFVHAAGFIGGNKTLKGVMQMADTALRYEDATPDSKRAKKE